MVEADQGCSSRMLITCLFWKGGFSIYGDGCFRGSGGRCYARRSFGGVGVNPIGTGYCYSSTSRKARARCSPRNGSQRTTMQLYAGTSSVICLGLC